MVEAVTAYRDALQERTRARAPLDWAMSTGNQGVALMLLAERRSDAKRWRNWRFSRSRRLSRQCATAAMRLRPPFMKRNYRKPARLPKNSPSADRVASDIFSSRAVPHRRNLKVRGRRLERISAFDRYC